MKTQRWLSLPLLVGLLSLQACSGEDNGDIFSPSQSGAGQGGAAAGASGQGGSSNAGQGGTAGSGAGQGGSTAGGGGSDAGAGGSDAGAGGSAAGVGGSDAGAGGSDAGAGGQAQGGAGAAGEAGSSGGDAGSGGTAGSAGQGGSAAGGANQGGAGGAAGSAGADPCGGTESTVMDLNKLPLPLPKTPYRLAGVVATSQKFLVSTAATGCLWGVFVTAPGNEVVEYGSIQLISKGAPPVTDSNGKAVCPTDGTKAGLIPNDVQPGDVLSVTGVADEFLLQQCGQSGNPKPEVGQRQVKDLTCLQVTAKGAALVSPKIISGTAVVDTIASGKNTNDLLRKYAGALVKLEGSFSSSQTPIDDYFPGSAVSKFGEIHVQQTSLSINNNIYYSDLSCEGPRDNSKRYEYSHPTTFTSFTGIFSLDFCSWQLSIRERCGDIAPLSSVCSGPECGAGGSAGSGGSGGAGGASGAEDSAGLCNDGLDNDGDNFIDCEDKSCCGAVNCKAIAPDSYCAKLAPELDPASCNDGLDNDLDGFVDCEDKGCCVHLDCKVLAPGSFCGTQGGGGSGGSFGGNAENSAALCSDGQDNDGDTFSDCEDFDCCPLLDCKTIAPQSACGKKGTPENTVALCGDGKDNDGDKFTDCDDFGCCDVVDCKTIAPQSSCATQP